MNMYRDAMLSNVEKTVHMISDERISSADLAYFENRLKNRFYDLVITQFELSAKEDGLTQAVLSRRLGKRPEQVNRWLSEPGNWTIGTISNLLYGIGQLEPILSIQPCYANNMVINASAADLELTACISYNCNGPAIARFPTPQPVAVLVYQQPASKSPTEK